MRGWLSRRRQGHLNGLIYATPETRRLQATPTFSALKAPSTMHIPPGIAFLARSLPHFFGPFVVTYFGLRLADTHLGVATPSWLSILLSLVSRPIIFILDRKTRSYRNARNAAALGATLPPRFEGSPLDAGKQIRDSFVHGYLTDFIDHWTRRYGPIVGYSGSNADAVCA